MKAGELFVEFMQVVMLSMGHAGRQYLTADALLIFCNCIIGDNLLPRPRLGALVIDFASVARGERPFDVLLAYAL